MLELFEVLDERLRLRVVAVELQSELAGLGEHVAAARQLGDQDARLVADQARVDVLIRVAMAQHSRYVLSTLMGESAIADERLLEGQGEVGDLRDCPRQLAEPP